MNSPSIPDNVRAICWQEGALRLLDQRALPERQHYVTCHDVGAVAAAIGAMVVRGAPAIGIAAAFGVVLAARRHYQHDARGWCQAMQPDLQALRAARPTAVNLAWAVDRMERRATELHGDPEPALLAEAHAILEADRAANRAMGALGANLLEPSTAVLTHCNAGALATGGFGTALGVVRTAFAMGRLRQVYADETRPWLQGSRLTAWELLQDGIPVTLLADGAAAWLMHRGEVDWVVVGADRIAANGDVANKIGTYAAAVAARRHGVRFMVVAPTSTVDLTTPSGAEIPIEQRAAAEVLAIAGHGVAAAGASAWNPVFDVTPVNLVDVLVTERAVVHQPNAMRIRQLIEGRPGDE